MLDSLLCKNGWNICSRCVYNTPKNEKTSPVEHSIDDYLKSKVIKKLKQTWKQIGIPGNLSCK